MQKNFFHTGEFAALCGVSKDTLFYYDRIGLLKPDTVAPNGYRCYSLSQSMALDTIQSLKKIGTPLREIKRYMGRQSSQAFLALLRQKQGELEEELRYLQGLQKQMERVAAIVENALTVPRGELLLEQHPAEAMLVTERKKNAPDSERTLLLTMREHVAACRELGVHEFPVGEIIPPEEIESGKFREYAYFSRLDGDVPEDSRIVWRQAGEYAVWYHEGSYESLNDAYRGFARMLVEKGYRLQGPIYEEDQINMLGASDENQYLLKILVAVERQD